MKKLIIIIFILISQITIAKVFVRDSITAYNQIEKIVYKLMLKDITIQVDYLDYRQGNHSMNIKGYMYTKDNVYHICIKKGLKSNEIKRIVTHEMIHVWQVYQGKLKVYRNGWVWNGTFYSITTPYKKQIHEQDAKILESNRFFN